MFRHKNVHLQSLERMREKCEIFSGKCPNGSRDTAEKAESSP